MPIKTTNGRSESSATAVFAALIGFLLVVVSCGGAGAEAELELEVGTGVDGFSPLREGAVINAESGDQGGQHVWFSVRARGVAEPVTISLELLVGEGADEPACSVETGEVDLEPVDQTRGLLGIPCFLIDGRQPEDQADVRLHAVLRDSAGNSAEAWATATFAIPEWQREGPPTEGSGFEAPPVGGEHGGGTAEVCGDGPSWTDVTADLGIPELWIGTASWGDLDGDGAPDLFVPAEAGGVYANRNGHFEPLPEEARLQNLTTGFSSSVADIDGDGDLDLIVGARARIEAAHNEGDLRFSRGQTLWTGDEGSAGVASVGVLDLDGDEYPDLYAVRVGEIFGGEHDPDAANVLLRGGPDGFGDVSARAPEVQAAGEYATYGFSYAPRPMFDQAPVLYIGNDRPANYAFAHVGGTEFVPIELPQHEWAIATMGVDHSYENDSGELTFAVSDLGAFPLFHMDADGTVEQMVDQVGWNVGFASGWGVVFGDFDNDGAEDLVLATGNKNRGELGEQLEALDTRMLFFRDTGDEALRFPNCSNWAGPRFDGSIIADYYCVAVADFDLDGCLDLVAAPADLGGDDSASGQQFTTSVTVLRNDCDYAGHWIGIRVPDRVGTTVAVTADGVTRWRDVKSAPGVGCRGDATALHFGLGDASSLEAVRVYRPDGAVEDLDPHAFTVDAWNSLE